jgi:hypothetical protein
MGRQKRHVFQLQYALTRAWDVQEKKRERDDYDAEKIWGRAANKGSAGIFSILLFFLLLSSFVPSTDPVRHTVQYAWV